MGKPSDWREVRRYGRQKGFWAYITDEDCRENGIDASKVRDWRPLSLGTDRGQIILDVRQGRRKR